MDKYAQALGISTPQADPSMPQASNNGIAPSYGGSYKASNLRSAAFIQPNEVMPDHNDGSPADIRNLQQALSQNMPPDARADMQRLLATKIANLNNSQQQASSGQQSGAPPADKYALALGIGGQSQNQPQAQNQDQSQDSQSWANKLLDHDRLGGLIANQASGMAGTVVGGLAGLKDLVMGKGTDAAADTVNRVRGALTYVPQQGTAAGDTVDYFNNSVLNPGALVAKAGDAAGSAIADAGYPAAGAIVNGAINAAPMLVGLKGSGAAKVPVAEIDAAVAPQGSVQSAQQAFAAKNAANATPDMQAPTAAAAADAATHLPTPAGIDPEVFAKATPDMQASIAADAAAGKMSLQAAKSHLDANTLPVPVRISKGQAFSDPSLISEELNTRGQQSPIVSPEFLKDQGVALAANIEKVRNSVAPDIADTGKTNLGQTLVDAYKKYDAGVTQDIAAKYKALEDANGGDFPIDGSTFAKNVDAALNKHLKTNSVPADIQSQLNEFKNGRQMTFQDFETLRSDAADAMRSASDGRQRAAANIIREQLENMPLAPEAASLKPLADVARNAARARFQALETDPAYKAAVSDNASEGEPTPLAEKFTDNHIVNGRNANILQMQKNLGDNPVAQQAIAAAQLENLAGNLKADPTSGKFNSDSFVKALKVQGPKLQTTLGDEAANTVNQIGRVAKTAQVQPRGSYVNNSNTLVGALASKAAGALEGVGNTAAFGIPVGTYLRDLASNAIANKSRSAQAAASTGIAPGMTSLSNIVRSPGEIAANSPQNVVPITNAGRRNISNVGGAVFLSNKGARD